DFRTPSEAAWARHVYHLYVVQTARRDDLQEGLRARGVETLVHYPVPCHLQPAFAYLGLKEGAFPIAERLAAEVLSLPLRPGMTAGEIELVSAGVRASLDLTDA